MVNQGRLAKVILSLMVAMTLGAFVLLMLEGQPIEPMEFSLSSPTQMRSVHSVLGTEPGVGLADWQQIAVCYRRNDGQLRPGQGLVGSFAKEYHFVISDGSVGGDGEIFASHRWTRQQLCGSDKVIRICLLGDPLHSVSTPNQARKLEKLVSSLVRHCQIAPNIVWTTR